MQAHNEAWGSGRVVVGEPFPVVKGKRLFRQLCLPFCRDERLVGVGRRRIRSPTEEHTYNEVRSFKFNSAILGERQETSKCDFVICFSLVRFLASPRFEST